MWSRNQHQLGEALLATSHRGDGMCHSSEAIIHHRLVDLKLNSWENQDLSRPLSV